MNIELFTALLVPVGAIQAGIFYWQGRVFRRTLNAIQGQTAVIQESISVARTSAAAAERSAEAAKASAEVAISGQRAWVMVDLEHVPGVGTVMYGSAREGSGPERHSVAARVRCVCSNQGKTPAKILEKRAALLLVDSGNPLPVQPRLDIEILDAVPQYLQSGQEAKRDWTLCTDGREEIGTTLVVYGFVKYRHIFSDREAYASFGYRITANYEFERLSDFPKYNENT
jgi:hypothetical protein